MTSLWLDRPRPAYDDPWPAAESTDDLVVGAGLTGLCTALLLARAGRRVAVVEARHVGAVTTGHTTGKVSLLQGTTLSGLLAAQPRRVRQGYVDANREGMEWLLRFCDEHGVETQRRDAVTYAATPDQVCRVHEEHDAARDLGLPTTLVDSLDVPFPLHAAVALADQAQLDAWEVLAALAEQVRRHGGSIHEGRRVVGVDSVSEAGQHSARVRLDDDSELRAQHVVLATGTPILDRGLHFARVEPLRSYALAFEHPHPPAAMYLSAGEPSRSLRTAAGRSGPALLVGGAGHVVGHGRPTSARFDELREWTHQHFAGAVETHAWSAQDYRSHTGVPIVGQVPLGGGAVYCATGFAKWGLSNGVAAAHSIVADILGSGAQGSQESGSRGDPLRWRAVLELARVNAQVGASLTLGHLGALLRAAPLPTGQRGSPSPICTHLGGRLTWNDAEGSWDCPLHGSRFGADGDVLEGPATRPLCIAAEPSSQA